MGVGHAANCQAYRHPFFELNSIRHFDRATEIGTIGRHLGNTVSRQQLPEDLGVPRSDSADSRCFCLVPHAMSLTQSFRYRNGQLFCEEVPLHAVAAQHGTPCYVYSKKAIRGNFHYFAKVFESVDPLICYAVKANSNLTILRLLQEAGSGFDVVSAGELHRLKTIGADTERTIFSGVGKTAEELKMALEMSLLSINIESIQELEVLIGLAARQNSPPRISLRINPEVDAKTHPYVATGFRQHKFGLDLNSLSRIVELLKGSTEVRLVGVGFHIGSQILDVQPFLDAFLKVKEVATSLRDQGFDITHLDLGGGIGIPYQMEPEADLGAYAEFLNAHRGNYRILFEPGRFMVGNAGVLLNRVLYHKVNHDKRFTVVDGAMNDLIRPALYGAYHAILPLLEKAQEQELAVSDVVGPICETGDFFARDRPLPKLKTGDYLAVMNAGAYGFVAASNYNSRPRPCEVLIDGDICRVIRAREGLDDLFRGEE